MLRAILKTVLALTAIGVCLLALSQLALAMRGRALSIVELAAAGLVLFIAVITALLRKKKHTQRKFQEMQDSALW